MYNQIEYKFKISIMKGSWRKYESKEETEGADCHADLYGYGAGEYDGI